MRVPASGRYPAACLLADCGAVRLPQAALTAGAVTGAVGAAPPAAAAMLGAIAARLAGAAAADGSPLAPPGAPYAFWHGVDGVVYSPRWCLACAEPTLVGVVPVAALAAEGAGFRCGVPLLSRAAVRAAVVAPGTAAPAPELVAARAAAAPLPAAAAPAGRGAKRVRQLQQRLVVHRVAAGAPVATPTAGAARGKPATDEDAGEGGKRLRGPEGGGDGAAEAPPSHGHDSDFESD